MLLILKREIYDNLKSPELRKSHHWAINFNSGSTLACKRDIHWRKVTRPKGSILACFASESEPQKHSKWEKFVWNNRCPLDLLWQTSHCATTPSCPPLLSPSQSSPCSLCSQSLDLFTCTWFYLVLNQRLHKNTALKPNLCLRQTFTALHLHAIPHCLPLLFLVFWSCFIDKFLLWNKPCI